MTRASDVIVILVSAAADDDDDDDDGDGGAGGVLSLSSSSSSSSRFPGKVSWNSTARGGSFDFNPAQGDLSTIFKGRLESSFERGQFGPPSPNLWQTNLVSGGRLVHNLYELL